MPRTYLRRSGWLQVTTLGNLFQWVQGAAAMDRQWTQIGAKCKSKWRNFHLFHLLSKEVVEKIGLSCHTLRPQMVQMMFT